MCHGAGERGHALPVSQAETNVWMGDEQLNDDAVLVTDGHMDRGPSLRILQRAAQHEMGCGYLNIWISTLHSVI